MVASRSSLPVIQSLWIGEDLTQIEKLCVQSYLDHGHEFHLYTYSEIGGVPAGALIKDGNEILPESAIFQNTSGSYAAFSDWFRYAMLAKKGGFWVDMDMICIKPFDFDSKIILAGGSDGYTTAIIGMPENHPLMVALEETCRNYQNKNYAGWGKIGGPEVLTQFVHKFGMEKYGRPYMYFYPWGSQVWQVAFDRTFSEGVNLYPNTHSVHLYNEMGRKIKLDKNAQFDSDSLVEQLKAKHRITPIRNAKRITSTDLNNAISQRMQDKATAKVNRKKKHYYILMGIAATLVIIVSLFGWL